MITKVFIFRHGQTDWNLTRRMQGHTDIPLNETGQQQAVKLKEFFTDRKIDLIISSDLSRAFETAKIVFDQMPIITSPILREFSLGNAEGKYIDELKQEFGEIQYKNFVDPYFLNFSFSGGDNKGEHLIRMKKYIEEIIFKHNPSQLAIATHGISSRLLIHHSSNPPKELVAIPSCCCYQLEFNHQKKQWLFKGPA